MHLVEGRSQDYPNNFARPSIITYEIVSFLSRDMTDAAVGLTSLTTVQILFVGLYTYRLLLMIPG